MTNPLNKKSITFRYYRTDGTTQRWSGMAYDTEHAVTIAKREDRCYWRICPIGQ